MKPIRFNTVKNVISGVRPQSFREISKSNDGPDFVSRVMLGEAVSHTLINVEDQTKNTKLEFCATAQFSISGTICLMFDEKQLPIDRYKRLHHESTWQTRDSPRLTALYLQLRASPYP